jgi:hypothetical protein
MKPVILTLLLIFEAMIVYGQGGLVQKNAQDTIPRKIDSLKAVIVTATMRPKFKGDTLDYNTEHILMGPNAAVEELLKRLPGLQIDATGNITYNGETIQHLLVDGEDIFGSDPTLVTRSFDASRIARVQILDRKTDQAIFTGIDDGTRTKALNLVLKESAKESYFGKTEAGGNSNGYYNANGILAAFRNKEQFAVLGLASNTGVLGFSNGSGGSPAGVAFLNGNADALNASAGTGIPRFEAIAVHYSNIWNDQSDHLMGNYQYSSYYTNPITTTQSLQTQPDSIYGQYQQSQSVNRQVQHLAIGIYDWHPSTTSSFHFTVREKNSQGQNQLAANGTSTFNDTLVNSSQRTIQDRVGRQSGGGEAYWSKRLSKRSDEVLSVNLGLSKTDSRTDGYLFSVDRFFQPNGNVIDIDSTDQRKQIEDHSTTINSGIGLSQPFMRGIKLGVSYVIEYNFYAPLQATYARGDGKYQELIDSLSSSFKTRIVNQRAMVNFQGEFGNLNYTFGNDWLGYSYRQQDNDLGSLLHSHFFNWAPHVLLNYSVDQTTKFNFSYNATTQQPTIAQLEPVLNNNDPLHINLGNPDLRPSVNQNFRLDFYRFRTWAINATATISIIDNAISNKTTTDSLGRQVSSPVNVGGGGTAGFNFSIDRKINGIDLGFHNFNTYTRSFTYINAALSRNDIYMVGEGINVSKYDEGRYLASLNANLIFFNQVSSVNPGAPVSYWTQNHQGSVTLFVVRNFEINTNAIYTWHQKTSAFTGNTSVLLWNAYVSRNFFQNKLIAKFQFNNILDQNAGITRSNLANVNTETSTNILGRYWMLLAVYHFDKKFRRK